MSRGYQAGDLLRRAWLNAIKTEINFEGKEAVREFERILRRELWAEFGAECWGSCSNFVERYNRVHKDQARMFSVKDILGVRLAMNLAAVTQSYLQQGCDFLESVQRTFYDFNALEGAPMSQDRLASVAGIVTERWDKGKDFGVAVTALKIVD